MSATGAPLKNIPVSSQSMSSDSVKRLESKAHEPNTCLLARATDDLGIDIERSYMIPRSIKVKEVLSFRYLALAINLLRSYVRVNGCSDTMPVLSILIHITM